MRPGIAIALFGLLAACEHGQNVRAAESGHPPPVAGDENPALDGGKTETAKSGPTHHGPKAHAKTEQVLAIEGDRPEADIKRVVQDHFTEIRNCFDLAVVHADQIDNQGATVIKFTVTAAGEVRSAEVELAELGDKATEACIASEVGHWKLPAAAADAVVHMPFYMHSF
ncbi:MAG: AgmX/PglI C-terminal domain-containing protein [Nannocystaceae bacterium]|nr:AgmX/PglI C-terminal domain-containing protein [Nannocystaceae bacterium]